MRGNTICSVRTLLFIAFVLTMVVIAHPARALVVEFIPANPTSAMKASFSVDDNQIGADGKFPFTAITEWSVQFVSPNTMESYQWELADIPAHSDTGFIYADCTVQIPLVTWSMKDAGDFLTKLTTIFGNNIQIWEEYSNPPPFQFFSFRRDGRWVVTDECEAPPRSGNAVMALMESQLVFTPALSSTPILSVDPSQAIPIGLGAVATGGETLDIRIGISEFSSPADVYFAVLSPDPLGGDILVYTGEAFVELSQSGLVPWIANTKGPLDEDLFGAFPLSHLSSGPYILFFAVAPAGSHMESFYLWRTEFTVP